MRVGEGFVVFAAPDQCIGLATKQFKTVPVQHFFVFQRVAFPYFFKKSNGFTNSSMDPRQSKPQEKQLSQHPLQLTTEIVPCIREQDM